MAFHARVESASWITPSMVRVVLGGPGLDGFEMPDATDAYVNVAIPPAGAPYDALFEPRAVREAHAEEVWPHPPPLHGADLGRGEPSADPGLRGARRRRRRRPVGRDGRAGRRAGVRGTGQRLPARPRVPTGTCWSATSPRCRPSPRRSRPSRRARRSSSAWSATAPTTRSPLDYPGRLDLQWLHRTGDAETGRRSCSPTRSPPRTSPPAGCRRSCTARPRRSGSIRRHLLTERGLTRADMSCSPYWRRTMTDEAWRRSSATSWPPWKRTSPDHHPVTVVAAWTTHEVRAVRPRRGGGERAR